MNEPTPKLIFFPGLGADHRLFAPQRTAFPDLWVPPWIPPHRGESLASYADRLAETLPRGEPLVLGGVSLGGMIAFEIARIVRPQAVILIASCRNRRGIRPAFRGGKILWPFVPKKIFSLAKLVARPALRIFGQTSPADQKLLIDMFREMDDAFMHWAVSAILRWNPPPLDGVPLFHLHGRRDRVIPARRVEPDAWIPNGGHLINVTHAKEVNEFIQRAIRQISVASS
jgi:pimeloyl-ACP methyl ester carboxylesterase